MSVETVINQSQDEFISELREFVGIKSISALPQHRADVRKTAEWIRDWILKNLPGSAVSFREIAYKQKHPCGDELELPPIVFAYANKPDRSKKTLLVYAHYDVQPAELSDGWDSEPFDLTITENGQMKGRGTTDDKGPLLGWLLMAKSYVTSGKELPVNMRLIFEGMEESGSVGFDDTVRAMSKDTDFFNNIDFACICDNYWLSDSRPCLSYGLRGLTECHMTVSGPKCDLHSGSNGGMTYEPMDDLIALMRSLKDNEGKILIEGIMDQVAQVTDDECERYKTLFFDVQRRKSDMGVTAIRDEEDKVKCLMNIWRFPSLSCHGIEGAYSDAGFKTVIPKKVTGKVSIRTVPNMEGKVTEAAIRKHLEKEFAKRKTANTLDIHTASGRWWYVDPTSSVFKAAAQAIRSVYNVDPDYTREGGSIPITLTLSEVAKCDLALIPMGRSDDGAHSQNEKLDVSNFMGGMKVFAAFVEELAKL